MFTEFFYTLRDKGLAVSQDEWLSLMEALDKGLCAPNLVDFYFLSRAILIKSEGEYDKFDLAFASYFKDVKTEEDIPDEVFQWLQGGERSKEELMERLKALGNHDLTLEELQKMLEERLAEQTSRHSGGNYWIGTGGTSKLGHGGYNTQGIRVGGESRYRSALQVARQRDFRDFRQDNTLDTRQFQMAFRKLRQFSARVEGDKTELDMDGTVRATCDNAGRLELVWAHPRKNTVKLLLLFDSDGSMIYYNKLCSSLFQAVSKSSHFKDLQVYYFHNCVYEHLYKSPHCRRGDWVDTNWVFSNLGADYKVIVVGDAAMAPSELLQVGGNNTYGLYNDEPGIKWLQRIKQRYPHAVWLNPIQEDRWDWTYGSYTIDLVRKVFPMYQLSLEGLEKAVKKLLNR